MLDGIEELLEKKSVRYIRIDGGTKSSARNSLVQQFQTDDKTRVALLSIAACYSGLTLTAAQTVICQLMII